MSVPGVGYVTALSFKAAVDDPARFKSSRTVGAHFGLTPRRFQSGEKDNPGRISHAGDADVRARRRAIVAVARKIAVVLHRMWVDGTQFRFGSEAAV
ncbi:transposase [Rhizobium sp. LjRoot258]|jgi:transposase|uniref:transposase n=1 Tax=Rhizobium sp. LjRoot258 TaxID=3342299 RepID=UPI003ED0D379